ncbi:MAG TPA: nuclear transport factor 2 family protein [Acidimicrobiia bacterium]|nr:nuclear transport factor 2 family protein [Acidimicrobiia bacterium]
MRGCRRYARVIASAGAILIAFGALTVTTTTVNAESRILTAVEMDDEFVRLWNANKLDELVEFYYVDDAVVVPPNHDPVRGKKNIHEYFKGIRPMIGELQTGLQHHQVVVTDDMTSVVGNYAAHNGHMRINAHEAFVRQADGTLKVVADMFGMR